MDKNLYKCPSSRAALSNYLQNPFHPCVLSRHMEYSDATKELLNGAGASIGDHISVTTRGAVQRGMVMPRHMFTGPDILVLKLSSGYNIGLRIGEGTTLVLIEEAKKEERPSSTPPGTGLPPVAFLSTGGTIASYVDYRTGAVHPAVEAQDLLFTVPELSDLCEVRSTVLSSILSEDMDVALWQELANAIVLEFEKGARGVIVPHGTDTLGYTAAALSYMLTSLPGPVVLVGSQRSSDRPSSDATMNLLAATRVALAPIGEVVVVMHDSSSDDRCAIHRGSRVRKMHTSRRDAFQSINTLPLGYVEGKEVTILEKVRGLEKRAAADTRMEPNVVLVHAYPGITPAQFSGMTSGAKGVVIAGTGLGHISSDIVPVISKLVAGGVRVVMTSQCLWGSTNLNVYSTGRELLQAGVEPCGDMLPETALVELMCRLARQPGKRGTDAGHRRERHE